MESLEARNFMKWNIAEFISVSHLTVHYVQHKPITDLLDTFLDRLQLFCPVYVVGSADSLPGGAYLGP
jgi:hypothetical protein